MSTLSLSEFLQIDPKDLEVGVTKFNSNILLTTYEVSLDINAKDIHLVSQKRYTEFQGFYDSLTIRYQNLIFPEFPSKFQLINKKEKRKMFFDSLLKTVQQLACSHGEIKKDLLKLIYEFVIGTSPPELVKRASCITEATMANNSNFETKSMNSSIIKFDDTKSVSRFLN
jgi:hypothetical protein